MTMNRIGKYKNGNTIVSIYSDGTKVRFTKDNEFHPEFAENIDLKITNKCTGTNCPYCHEGSNPCGKHSDILNEKFVNTLKPYQEVAIGGGNVLEHPDLIELLRRLKALKVIANITVNQIHFEKNFDFIQELVNEELIYGLGISLMNPTDEFIEKAKKFPNSVIHVINGIISKEDINKISNQGLKILILGYKMLRRGEDYFEKEDEKINERKEFLYNNLGDYINKFETVSFDNLAIEQLNVKRFLSDEEWEEFYMGDDASFTYYIDAVERKFAKNSTAPMNERYDLLDNVEKMFKIIKKKEA